MVYENEDGCAIEEGCLTGYGDRYIIRFSTWIKNVGNQDYFKTKVNFNQTDKSLFSFETKSLSFPSTPLPE